jgi:hypothetical protein
LEGLAIEDIVTFDGHLVYFMAVWYSLWPFGTIFPVLVCCTMKNLATLVCGELLPPGNWKTIGGKVGQKASFDFLDRRQKNEVAKNGRKQSLRNE